MTKRTHLYALPTDTALPADTSALPEGYPLVVDGVIYYVDYDGGWEPGRAVADIGPLPADPTGLPEGKLLIDDDGVLHRIDAAETIQAAKTQFARIATGASTTVALPCVLVGCTAEGITITLASAMVAEGAWVDVKDESGAAGATAITVATEGSETIDGATSQPINANYGALRFYSDGTNWFTR